MSLFRSAGWLMMSAIMLGGAVMAFGSAGVLQALTDEPSPPPVVMASSNAGPRMVALQADSRGHFVTDVRANNQFIRVLVDTGASVVALTAEDARKLGISPAQGFGTAQVSTANGVVRVATVRIPELRLQSLVVRDVEAVIMPAGAMPNTLLGMSFIKRLGSFEMQGKTLVLKQ